MQGHRAAPDAERQIGIAGARGLVALCPIGGRRNLRYAPVPSNLLHIPLGAPLLRGHPLLQPPPFLGGKRLNLGARISHPPGEMLMLGAIGLDRPEMAHENSAFAENARHPPEQFVAIINAVDHVNAKPENALITVIGGERFGHEGQIVTVTLLDHFPKWLRHLGSELWEYVPDQAPPSEDVIQGTTGVPVAGCAKQPSRMLGQRLAKVMDIERNRFEAASVSPNRHQADLDRLLKERIAAGLAGDLSSKSLTDIVEEEMLSPITDDRLPGQV